MSRRGALLAARVHMNTTELELELELDEHDRIRAR